MTPRKRAEPALVLLPYYAQTLLRIRNDLGLSLVAMADALSETEWRPHLVRWSREDRARGYTDKNVEQSTISRLERGDREMWPANPDAWVCAYAEVAGLEPYEVWGEAMARWAERLEAPDAVAAARRAAERARRAAESQTP